MLETAQPCSPSLTSRQLDPHFTAKAHVVVQLGLVNPQSTATLAAPHCLQLLRHLLHRHFADGSDLPHHATSSPPLLSREDIKKRAKTAQLKVLDKQRREAEQLPQHMLEQLGRQQREMADRLEKLAGAADRTSSELRQLTVERRAAQFERRDGGNATAGSTRDQGAPSLGRSTSPILGERFLSRFGDDDGGTSSCRW